jgi:hypothetical protein
MKRINLGGGVWFDRDKATGFEESTHWDGNNHISDATWLADNGHVEAAEAASPGCLLASEV